MPRPSPFPPPQGGGNEKEGAEHVASQFYSVRGDYLLPNLCGEVGLTIKPWGVGLQGCRCPND